MGTSSIQTYMSTVLERIFMDEHFVDHEIVQCHKLAHINNHIIPHGDVKAVIKEFFSLNTRTGDAEKALESLSIAHKTI